MTSIHARPLLTRLAFAFLWLFVFTLPLTQLTEFPLLKMASSIIGLATIVSGAAAVASRGSIRLLGSFHMMMAAFIVWSAVTLCWSVAPQLTVDRIMTDLQLFVLVVLVWEFCREEKDVLRLLGAFVLGTIIPAFMTVSAFVPGQETLYHRAVSVGFDPESLPFLLAMSLPASYYLVLREKSVITALYRLQMGLTVCAILFTGSTATMIAMTVGLSLVCWTFHLVDVGTRARAFGLIVVLALAAFLFLPANLMQHISQESRSGALTLDAALDAVRSTPVGGFGAGSLALRPAVSHGASFTLFAETGVVGVACFSGLLGLLFLAAESMSGATKSFWFTLLGVFAVGLCALNWECSRPAWLLLGLLAAHSACLKKEGVSPEEQRQQRSFYVEEGAAEVWS